LYRRKEGYNYLETGNLLLSLLQFLLISAALTVARVIWEYPIPEGFSKYFAIIPLVGLAVYNHHKYNKKGKYRIFREKWKNEPNSQRNKRGWLIVIFYIASILTVILYGIIRHNIIGGKSFLGP
jgi:polyferredoxin